METLCYVGAALTALAIIVRAGSSFRAEYKGMVKFEVTPPDIPRPPAK